ncbi:MAG: septum formation family protein [Acidimicrobiales bacterium]
MKRLLLLVVPVVVALSACDGDDQVGVEDAEVTAATASESAGGSTSAPPPEPVSVFELEAGMCIESIDAAQGSSLEEVDVVDCDAAHEAEVFSVFDIEGADDELFPGTSTVEATAATGCEERYDEYVGISFQDSRLQATYLAPNEQTWAQGDREVVCIAFADDGELDGSIEGSRE